MFTNISPTSHVYGEEYARICGLITIGLGHPDYRLQKPLAAGGMCGGTGFAGIRLGKTSGIQGASFVQQRLYLTNYILGVIGSEVSQDL